MDRLHGWKVDEYIAWQIEGLVKDGVAGGWVSVGWVVAG